MHEDVFKGINWINSKATEGLCYIDDLTEEPLKDCSVTTKVKQKISVPKVYFRQGKPILNCDITLSVEVEEIQSKEIKTHLYDSSKLFVTNELKARITDKIANDIAIAAAFCKENALDAVQAYKYFHAFQSKELKKYLKTHTVDEFVKNLEYEHTVHIITR